MNIKLVCFDLDGTFLDEQKNIPERNIIALEKAAEQGVYIVPATGRTYPGIPEAIRKLPFVRYCITANGACIYDAQEDKVLSLATIPLPLAMRFYDYADTLPVVYDCYKQSGGYANLSMWPLYEKYIPDAHLRKHVMEMRKPVENLKAYLLESGEGLLKMQMFFVDMEERQRQLDILPGLFPELAFSSSIPGNIEVNILDGTKGHAILKLCDILGLDREQSLAIGDGSNDRDMLIRAGLGIAMENASEELKLVADHVTGHCNDAGVAQAIEKFVLS